MLACLRPFLFGFVTHEPPCYFKGSALSKGKDQMKNILKAISNRGGINIDPPSSRTKATTVAVLLLVFVLTHVSVAAATGQSVSGIGLVNLVLKAANTVVLGKKGDQTATGNAKNSSDESADSVAPPCQRGRNPSPGQPRGRNEECRE